MAKKKVVEPPASEGEAETPAAVPEEPAAEAPPKAAAAAKPRKTRAKEGGAPRAAKKPREKAAPAANEVHVYSLDGDVVKNIELPAVFRSPLRFDLIRRAVTAFQSNRRQTFGPNRKAGMRHSVRWSGKGQGVSRVPRIRGTMIGAQAPGTVGGRKGHPPKPWADYYRKVNAKERGKARAAALAALRVADLVTRRGHRFASGRTLPIVVENALEEAEEDDLTVSRGVAIFRALGVYEDVERALAGTHIRAGKGKTRGRRYRTPKSVLLVASNPAAVERCFGNLPGVDVVSPGHLNAEVLAPGGDPGRLAVFTESAIEALRGWNP